MFLHAGLESAEIIHLGPKHQVGQLSIGQEDDKEHDSKAHQVLGTARHSTGQLAHGLIEVDELEKLRGLNQRVSISLRWLVCLVCTNYGLIQNQSKRFIP